MANLKSSFQNIIRTQNDIAPTIARVTAGLVMLPHGLQKTLGWFGGYGFSGTMDYFTGTGLPWIAALLVVLGESLGALGLITGTLSRVAAFGFVSIMTGAIFMGHAEHGFFMNWYGAQQGEGFEYHLLMIGLAVIVLIKGSGAFSIDRALVKD